MEDMTKLLIGVIVAGLFLIGKLFFFSLQPRDARSAGIPGRFLPTAVANDRGTIFSICGETAAWK